MIVALVVVWILAISFPTSSDIKKIHLVGCNVHHFMYANIIADAIKGLKFTEHIERFNGGHTFSYYNSPSAFWVALLMVPIPTEFRGLFYSFINLIALPFGATLLLWMSRGVSLWFLSALIIYLGTILIFMMYGGDVIAHFFPCTLILASWYMLKRSFKGEKKALEKSAILSGVACFMNLTFIIPIAIMTLCYLSKLKRNFLRFATIVGVISLPFAILFLIQHARFVSPVLDHVNFIEKNIIGDEIDIIASYMLLSALSKPLLLFSFVMAWIRRNEILDIVFATILLLLFAVSLLPHPIPKMLFTYKFEPIASVILAFTTLKDLKKTNIFLVFLSVVTTLFISRLPLTFKNFPYRFYTELGSYVESLLKDTILVESAPIDDLVAEDAGLMFLLTNKRVFGLIYPPNRESVILVGDTILAPSNGEMYEFKVPSEEFRRLLVDNDIDYILCQSRKCRKSINYLCPLQAHFLARTIRGLKLYSLHTCQL